MESYGNLWGERENLNCLRYFSRLPSSRSWNRNFVTLTICSRSNVQISRNLSFEKGGGENSEVGITNITTNITRQTKMISLLEQISQQISKYYNKYYKKDTNYQHVWTTKLLPQMCRSEYSQRTLPHPRCWSPDRNIRIF